MHCQHQEKPEQALNGSNQEPSQMYMYTLESPSQYLLAAS